MNPRPNGILLLGSLAILAGMLNFLAGLVLMLIGPVGTAFGSSAGTAALIIGTLMFATGVVSLAIGYGLWRAYRWAWAGAFVIFGTNLFIDLCSVVLAGVSPLTIVVNVGISVVAMWFLLQPATRATFGHGPTPTA